MIGVRGLSLVLVWWLLWQSSLCFWSETVPDIFAAAVAEAVSAAPRVSRGRVAEALAQSAANVVVLWYLDAYSTGTESCAT